MATSNEYNFICQYVILIQFAADLFVRYILSSKAHLIFGESLLAWLQLD